MEQAHVFTATAHWRGGLLGEGRCEGRGIGSVISVPTELRGPGLGTNPEELLVSAAASCFLITLAAVLQRLEVATEKLELSSSGTFVFDGRSLRMTGIEHQLQICPVGTWTPAEQDNVRIALERAEAGCMVSRALSVPVKVVSRH